MIQVKANSVSHLTDARYFASMGVQWLGFNLDTMDEKASDVHFVKAIREWISGPSFVGEFNLTPATEILSVAENIGLDAIQLGPFFDYNQIGLLASSYTLFSEIRIDENMPSPTILPFLQQHKKEIHAFIFNFSQPFESISDAWKNTLISFSEEFSIFIAASGSSDDILAAIHTFKPQGICLSGGSEEKIGVKSFDELDEIFEQLSELGLN